MISDESIRTYMDIFINRYDIWGNAVADEDDPEHAKVFYRKPEQKWPPYEPVSLSLVRRHLEASVTCHWTAVDENGCSKWLAYDGDENNDHLDLLQEYLTSHGWNILRTRGRFDRPGHLFLCLNKPVCVKLLRIFAWESMKKAGVSNLELFPASDIGLSQLRGPLGKNAKLAANGAIDWFVGPDKILQEQLSWLAEQPVNDADDLTRVAEMFRPLPTSRIRTQASIIHPGRIDFRVISQAALSHAKEVVEYWLPEGKGNSQYTALNPRRNDRSLGSFVINLRSGIWKDFATQDAKGGDLISLVAYIEQCGQLEAAKKLAAFLQDRGSA